MRHGPTPIGGCFAGLSKTGLSVRSAVHLKTVTGSELEHPSTSPDQAFLVSEIDVPDFAAMARVAEERSRAIRAAAIDPENVSATLRRLVEASAPVEEDGGSEADRETFSEAFQDACFVVACLGDEG